MSNEQLAMCNDSQSRKMKYSGVEWIGEIPEHWEINRLKNKISTHFGGCWGEDAKGNEFDVLCIRIADFDFPSQSVKPTASTFRNYTQSQIEKGLLKNGDLIIEKSGGGDKTPVGRVIVYNSELFPKAMFANFSECIRPKEIKISFLAYQLKSLYYSVDMHYFFNQTTGLQNLDMQTYLNALLCIPPLSEQQSIADILDRKCTQIDALIANEEQQIAKLKAYKQSVITETVTKGLTPDVPMKDSGVEWIGDIPEHWEVISLSQLSKSMRNGYVGPTKNLFVDTGIRYIQSLHIKEGEIDFSKHEYYVLEEWANQHPKIFTGNLLIVQTGDIGQVGVVTEEYNGCNCHALIIVDVKNESILSEYLSYFLQSKVGKELLLSTKTGALLPHLNSGRIGSTIVCVPPLQEQNYIVESLNRKCSQINGLITLKQQKIEKIQQYKKSVIYEYVTGKREVST